MTSNWKWIAVATAGIALAGCNRGGTAQGGLRGRILSVNGQAASGARVMLDKTSGKSVLASATGEFHLAAAAGTHHLLVYQPGVNAAAAATVSVQANADVNVGDVVLEDCGLVTANGGTTGAPNDPAPSPVPTDPSTTPPCQIDPPPPPPASIHFDTLTASYASGTIDPSGIYGWGEDDASGASFSFFLAGDFTNGGSASVHVNNVPPPDPNGPPTQLPAGDMQLYVWDANSGYGYAYELATGDLSVNVVAEPSPTATATTTATATPLGTPDPNGGPCVGADGGPCEPCYGTDPTTGGNTSGGIICPGDGMHFDFKATNLTFDYVDWSGTVDATHVATVDTALASGDAWVYLPPPPPPASISVSFVADWTTIVDCPGCAADPSGSTNGPGGDALYVYSYDSTDGVDLSYYLPVSDLALPGTVALDSTSIWGSADVYSGNWFYTFDNGSFSSTSTAVTDGDTLNLTVANQLFDWTGNGGGPQPLASAGGSGSGGGTPVNATLTIVSGDLSGTVEAACGTPVPVSGGGGTGTGVVNGTATGSVTVN